MLGFIFCVIIDMFYLISVIVFRINDLCFIKINLNKESNHKTNVMV